MKYRIILVAADPDICRKYIDAIKMPDVQIEAVSSLPELCQVLITPCNGLLLDMPTYMRDKLFQKEAAKEIFDIFPVIRLRWDQRGQRVRALVIEPVYEKGLGLEEMIRQHILTFKARSLRGSSRVALHFNVLLSADRQFADGDTEKSVTMDISPGGCLLFSVRDWENHEQVWIKMLELADNSPIQVEIRWRRRWGHQPQIPGIGVRFLEIKPGQLQEITERLQATAYPPARP